MFGVDAIDAELNQSLGVSEGARTYFEARRR